MVNSTLSKIILVSAIAVTGCSEQTYIKVLPDADFSGYLKTNPKTSAGVSMPDISQKLIRYADPFIGTGAHGHTFPGASMPFGMVQISPDNEYIGWDWCSGYNMFGKKISGFSHKHLSGTGARDLGDISFLPSESGGAESIQFSHSKEYACPGYYAVRMDNGILAEFTAGIRSTYHRYTFPGNEGFIRIDLAHDLRGGKKNLIRSQFVQSGSTRLGGYKLAKGWAPERHVYFFAEFSSPFRIQTTDTTAVLHFDAKSVSVRVGLSSVSIDGARLNMKEIGGISFDAALSNAFNEWEREFRKFSITGNNETDKRVFYTSVYHAFLAPTVFSDMDGKYTAQNGSVLNADEFTRYSTFSLWDTFRAAHPLYTLTQKNRVNDFINSLLAHYDVNGHLPRWELEATDTLCMIGNHSIPVIVEAYLKGFRGFDAEKAYAACKMTSMQNTDGLSEFRKYGFVPSDRSNESVSKTLEYSYDYWCMYLFAKALGKKSDSEMFLGYSGNYAHLFDTRLKYVRPVKSDGTFKEPFDPGAVESGKDRNYTEGNAFQWSWFVPQDIDGLVKLYGGGRSFESELDKFFSAPVRSDQIGIPDVTGLIGAYAHGNEPSHHIAYLYSSIGNLASTARTVDRIRKTLYTDKPDGLCGNDDCGQMSSWYIWSAMGFYPVDPVSLRYQLGTPLFDRFVLNLEDGKKFIVRAVRTSPKSIVPVKVMLNGKKLARTWIDYREIISGGELVFYLE